MRPLALLLLLPVGCSDYDLSKSDDEAGGDVGAECATDPLLGYGALADAACATTPTVGSFDPVVEWAWTENTAYPGYSQVMSTPAVGDLDGDGLPDIVFTAFSGTAWNEPGSLVRLTGRGDVVFELAGAGGYRVQGSAAPAIGDIDADGHPDICVPSDAAALLCLEGDGTFKWAAGSGYGHRSGQEAYTTTSRFC